LDLRPVATSTYAFATYVNVAQQRMPFLCAVGKSLVYKGLFSKTVAVFHSCLPSVSSQSSQAMKHFLLTGFLLLVLSGVMQPTQAQVGLGTTTADVAAALCISTLNKGVLFPSVGSTALAAAVAVPSLTLGQRVYIINAAVGAWPAIQQPILPPTT
jgi:hypothetical protein